MYGMSEDFEHNPDHETKTRLDDFLYELRALSKRYGIVFDGNVDGAENALIDARTDKIVGYNLGHVLLEGAEVPTVIGYDCEASIQDGSWLVLDDKGDLVEQMTVDGRQELFFRRNLGR
jgi:hypothetical protein